MKRFGVFVILFSFLALSAAWLASAAAISVVNSKHNLSYNLATSGTGSIKSVDPAIGGTSEVCVFCHTPHGGNTAVPLWNRSAPVQTYVTYTSDVLAGLVYWAAEDPNTHVKTKICLSCHDGTIALGSLVNLPYGASSQIPMDGTAGADVQYGMPKTAAGYIGLNLSDDHPVAIKHDSAKDLGELVSGASVSAAVRLYTAAGNNVNADGNYVECTSCHEPHDNQYGKFLVESNAGSALCTQCHTKTGFANSIHDLAGTAYSPLTGGTPATLGATVGGVKCMNCHFPHKAAGTGSPPNLTPADLTTYPKAGYYLLSFSEEGSCFNTNNDRYNTPGSANVCHGTGATTTTKNIAGLVGLSSSAHRVGSFVGIHEATEARGLTNGWLGAGNAKWHVECADCHNPHTASNTPHTEGINAIASTSPLYGTGGVSVGAYPAMPSPPGSGTYTPIQAAGVTNSVVTTVIKEYEICLKCHSDYAWGIGTIPNSPTWITMTLTNQAAEFNPANISHHPVAGTNINTEGTYTGSWNSGTQTMYCSDCHTKSGGGTPAGPHGSTATYGGSPQASQPGFILAKNYTDNYGTGGQGDADKQPNTDLCFNCHAQAEYLPSTNYVSTGTGFRTAGNVNLHTQHAFRAIPANTTTVNPIPYRCVNCHIRVPHGWSARKAMIVIKNDGLTYGAQYELATGAAITGIVTGNLPGSGNYGAAKGANCNTVNGCHQ